MPAREEGDVRKAVPFRRKPQNDGSPIIPPSKAWCHIHKSVTPVVVGPFFYCPVEGCTRKTTKPKRA